MSQDVQVNERDLAQARRHAQNLNRFDYNAPAELFPSRNKKCRTQARYKRFATAAEAVRFAVEEVPAPAMVGAYLVVEDGRFGADEIHYLYDHAGFPLKRAAKSA